MNGYLDMELLRFSTAGSVDDGKSTLIGRLLYDSKSIFEDQLEAVVEASARSGGEEVNLALLTDGLRAEREQGITIDVAYRYFATPKRKFIIADTPGHIQYTRNMVTGASTADLSIILIDSRNGIIEQTIRHSYIAKLLAIPYVVVCVNKMDLIEFNEDVFNDIKEKYTDLASKLELPNVQFIPISAKFGDNVVDRSDNMKWYKGTPLLEILENTQIDHKINSEDSRLPIQWIVRPMNDEFHDYRGYAGRMAGGTLRKGDAITTLPSGQKSTIKAIYDGDQEIQEAVTPLSIDVTLTSDIDIIRGDMIVGSDSKQPTVSQDLTMMVCWLHEKPMQQGGRYVIRHTSASVKGIIRSIDYKINIDTLDKIIGVESLQMNDIAKVTIKTASPLVFDPYAVNRTTGSVVFIDEATNETVGAGMIE